METTHTITLYHVHWCPECQIVQQKLKALRILYNSIIVPDSHAERTQVLEISGQSYVPVLKDGDRIFTETADILSHIERTYGRKATSS